MFNIKKQKSNNSTTCTTTTTPLSTTTTTTTSNKYNYDYYLDQIGLKYIENYIRRKKLKNINK